jgi:hypothetical protein
LKRTQRIWAKVTSILLFHLYFYHLGRLCITKNEYFREKTETNLSTNFNSPSPFSPVREQIFSKILLYYIILKAITFQKEKITCQLTVQFTSAKVMNITAVTKKISQKFNFTGKCLFLQQCINQALLQ